MENQRLSHTVQQDFAVVITPAEGFSTRTLTKLKRLSIVQTVTGAFGLLGGVLLLIIDKSVYSTNGYPMWIGAYYTAVGCMGLATGRHNKNCWIMMLMILNIMCSLAASVCIGQYCISQLTNYGTGECTSSASNCRSDTTIKFLTGFVLAASVIELPVNIWISVLCCRNVCQCCQSPYDRNFGFRSIVKYKKLGEGS